MKKTLWALISQIPLVGIGAAWGKSLVQHPTTLIAIFLVYEIFSFFFIFSSKLWKIFEQQLLEAIAEYLKVVVLNLISRFRRYYNKQIKNEHFFFNIRGLQTTVSSPLEVEKLYVEPLLAPAYLQEKVSMNPTAFWEISGSAPIWEYLRGMKKLDLLVLVVIGPPGCGKTALLQHMALTLVTNKQNQYGLRPYTPLFLFLREHVLMIQKESPNLAELAHSHFSDSKRYPNLKPPPDWFGRYLRAGKCIVLLDGLDEVGDKKQRVVISKWVDKQIIAYSDCLFVITSRSASYQDAPLRQAHVLGMMPFNGTQISSFVNNFYLPHKIIPYLKNGKHLDSKGQAKDLLARLRGHPTLSTLMINPLLLTMMAIVHNHLAFLPERRVELYEKIYDVLLGDWGVGQKIYNSLTTKQRKVLLQPLAAYMMEKKKESERRTISTEEASEVIAPYIKQLGIEENQISTFLHDVQAISGLLLKNKIGMWSFAHYTFQEYLCSCCWHETGETKDWGHEKWQTLVFDPWWHETIRLFAAQRDPTFLAKICLDFNTISSLTLAVDIAKEAVDKDAPVLMKLNSILNQDIESSDPAKSRLAAEVLLTRRLNKSFRPVDDKHEIDTTLITCAEYQLFLDYMKSQNRYLQPDHWTSLRFPKGCGLMPIVGVRFEDAQAFCLWLSQTQGQKYRLPTQQETCLFPIEHSAVSHISENRKLCGLSPEIETELKESLMEETNLPFAFNINIAFLYNQEIVSTTAHRLARFIDLTRSPDFVRDLQQTIEFIISSIFNRNVERTSDPNINLKFAYALACDLARAVDLARVLELGEDIASFFAHEKSIDFKDFLKIVKSIESKHLSEAISTIQRIKLIGLPEKFQRLLDLTFDALHGAQVKKFEEWQQANRTFILQMFMHVYNEMMSPHKTEHSRWNRWSRKTKFEKEELEEKMLELFRFLWLVQERKLGNLPAWEGIRLVRKRR